MVVITCDIIAASNKNERCSVVVPSNLEMEIDALCFVRSG